MRTGGPAGAKRTVGAVEKAVTEAVPPGPSRRRLLGMAGTTLGAVGVGAALTGIAVPAHAADRYENHDDGDDCRDPNEILTVLTSVEAFGVTFLSEAVRRAPGTPSEKFAPVLKSANTAEYDHYRALRRIGARPLSTRIWIPEAAFGAGGIGLFQAIEKEEGIEISAYLVGVTLFSRYRDAAGARLCAEALGVESEHRVAARTAQSMLGDPSLVPDNRGFESFPYTTARSALRAHEALGIRYGTKGPTPGRFYDFPGDPLDTGLGLPVESTMPA